MSPSTDNPISATFDPDARWNALARVAAARTAVSNIVGLDTELDSRTRAFEGRVQNFFNQWLEGSADRLAISLSALNNAATSLQAQPHPQLAQVRTALSELATAVRESYINTLSTYETRLTDAINATDRRIGTLSSVFEGIQNHTTMRNAVDIALLQSTSLATRQVCDWGVGFTRNQVVAERSARGGRRTTQHYGSDAVSLIDNAALATQTCINTITSSLSQWREGAQDQTSDSAYISTTTDLQELSRGMESMRKLTADLQSVRQLRTPARGGTETVVSSSRR